MMCSLGLKLEPPILKLEHLEESTKSSAHDPTVSSHEHVALRLDDASEDSCMVHEFDALTGYNFSTSRI